MCASSIVSVARLMVLSFSIEAVEKEQRSPALYRERCSANTEPAKRSRAAGFGNTPMPSRKRGEREQVVSRVVEHDRNPGVGATQNRDDLGELLADVVRIRSSKERADDGGPMSLLPFGTAARTFCMNCTRKRCQLAPSRTRLIAFSNPVCALNVTNDTPRSPRVFKDCRNPVQKALFSAPPTSTPSAPRRLSAAIPTATTTAWDTIRCHACAGL